MHSCKNCGATNEAGAMRCRICRIPGDFGQAPQAEAKVLSPQLIDCGNCARQAPVTALHCPSCRWPLKAQTATPSQVLPEGEAQKQPASHRHNEAHLRRIA